MIEVEKALPNYLGILRKEQKPRFKLLKESGELNRKISKAKVILRSCELCERRCRANRTAGELGWCKAPNRIVLSSYLVHFGEEQFFVPSFTVFFWSCTFSCQFCQNWTISQRQEIGHIYSEEDLAEVIDKNSACNNVNFVGGEPTPYLPFILKTMKFVKSDIPVVWNSNFYMTEKSIELLRGFVDVYLSDFKYGNNECAARLSRVNTYFGVVSKNHKLAFEDAELVVRHLVLPNHFECCTKPVLEFIAENFGDKVIVNVMNQYRPYYKANEYKEINRCLTAEEFEKAVKLAEELKLNFIT
jgi:putative pyruvate formate lyase activating enzyme